MKKFLLSTIVPAIALMAFDATAASPTNLLQTVSVKFTIYSPGTSTTNKDGTVTTPVDISSLGTKGLIAALVTNASSKASLDIVSPISDIGTNYTYTTNRTRVTTITNVVLTNYSSNSYLAVVDGASVTDISTNVLSLVTSSPEIESSVVTSNGTVVAYTKYGISTMTLNTSSISFVASGFKTGALDAIKVGKYTFEVKNTSIPLAGSGTETANAVPILVDGTLTVTSGGTYVQ
jgi:hypothetical protein